MCLGHATLPRPPPSAPPKGLDARAAAIVMRAVRAVGDSGRTLLVTIHQPSIEIFESFDRCAAGAAAGWRKVSGCREVPRWVQGQPAMLPCTASRPWPMSCASARLPAGCC
jgi:hypothetical protein